MRSSFTYAMEKITKEISTVLPLLDVVRVSAYVIIGVVSALVAATGIIVKICIKITNDVKIFINDKFLLQEKMIERTQIKIEELDSFCRKHENNLISVQKDIEFRRDICDNQHHWKGNERRRNNK
jgi:hypothetical protein